MGGKRSINLNICRTGHLKARQRRIVASFRERGLLEFMAKNTSWFSGELEEPLPVKSGKYGTILISIYGSLQCKFLCVGAEEQEHWMVLHTKSYWALFNEVALQVDFAALLMSVLELDTCR